MTEEGPSKNHNDTQSLVREAEKRGERKAIEQLKRTIQEYTMCSVCQSNARNQSLQCKNGHITCHTCLRNVTACPVCRETMDMHNKIRSLVADQIIVAIVAGNFLYPFNFFCMSTYTTRVGNDHGCDQIFKLNLANWSNIRPCTTIYSDTVL